MQEHTLVSGWRWWLYCQEVIQWGAVRMTIDASVDAAWRALLVGDPTAPDLDRNVHTLRWYLGEQQQCIKAQERLTQELHDHSRVFVH